MQQKHLHMMQKQFPPPPFRYSLGEIGKHGRLKIYSAMGIGSNPIVSIITLIFTFAFSMQKQDMHNGDDVARCISQRVSAEVEWNDALH